MLARMRINRTAGQGVTLTVTLENSLAVSYKTARITLLGLHLRGMKATFTGNMHVSVSSSLILDGQETAGNAKYPSAGERLK